LNRPPSFLAKLAWVDWLALSLVAIGIVSLISVFWLPALLGRLLDLGGGWYGGATGIAYLESLIGEASIGTGLLLLLTVRTLLRLRWRVLPLAFIAASVALLVGQDAVCPVVDKLTIFSPDTCTFLAPVLFPSLLIWSAIFAIRSEQVLRPMR